MTKIDLTLPHTLGRETAKERITKIADELGDTLMVQHSWSGDVLALTRPGANGTIAVSESAVKVHIELEMPAMIAAQVEHQLRKMLEAGLK